MRYMIGSQIGWVVVPALFVVGAAYVWVVSRILNRKPQVDVREHTPSVEQAA